MVPFVFFSTWAKTSKNRLLLYDVTIMRNVVERNIYFVGQKLMYRFGILHSRWQG